MRVKVGEWRRLSLLERWLILNGVYALQRGHGKL